MLKEIIRTRKRFYENIPEIKKRGVYIAGPISGRENYKKEFLDAEEFLHNNYIDIIFNPVHNPPGLDYEAYFPVCYAMIDTIGNILFLNDWEKSHGAKRERQYAIKHEKNYNFIEYREVVEDIKKLYLPIAIETNYKKRLHKYKITVKDVQEELIELSNKIERLIKRPMTQYGTTYENNIFKIKAFQFGDEGKEDVSNFIYKPKDVRIKWYYIIGNNASINKHMILTEFETMIKKCKESIKV